MGPQTLAALARPLGAPGFEAGARSAGFGLWTTVKIADGSRARERFVACFINRIVQLLPGSVIGKFG